tara:strand:+ start:35 stop:466 length:432 start_codon:yes stop_codon:yes gene_type:complete
MKGFIVNDATVASITTSYVVGQKILLHEDSAADANSRAMPQSGYLSHLEIQMDETGGTCANISLFLTWDSVGDDPMTAEAQSQLVHAGMTDVSLRNIAVSLDTWYTAPTGQTTAGKCYLFIKTNAGTVSLTKARLYWADRAGE